MCTFKSSFPSTSCGGWNYHRGKNHATLEGGEPLTGEKSLEWRADFHKALSNPARLKIVDFLLDGEQCQCDIFPYMGLSQSTVSAYLTQLVKADILSARRDGTRKLYRIKDAKLKKMIEQVRNMAEELV